MKQGSYTVLSTATVTVGYINKVINTVHNDSAILQVFWYMETVQWRTLTSLCLPVTVSLVM